MIVCCGEALVDMLPRKSADGEDVFRPVCGGAHFNTSITLGRLGEDVALASGLSTDMFGEQLIAELEASNVKTCLAIRSERPTTLAFVKLLNGSASYRFFDENSAGRMVKPEDFSAVSADVTALHFGGISLVAEPGASAFEAVMEKHCARAVISLDPNIRPALMTDPNNYRTRIERMAAMADIIKVSDEDLAWLCPNGGESNLIASWVENGAALVLVTKGADGADVYLPHETFVAPAHPASKVVDTIGAGDSFNGAFLAGLRRAGLLSKAALQGVTSAQLEPALDLAARVAAHVVCRAGANPPWAEELAPDAVF